MPVTLEDPDGGPIQIYAGDPKTIVITIQGQDRTNHSFSASLRRRPREAEAIVDFAVTAIYDGDDTIITCFLTGDSSPGEQDGQTRLIQTTAAGDVQEWNELGEAVETIAVFEVKATQDVTR